MKWVTRDRPKIDRLACIWLIKTRIDSAAELLFVPGEEVVAVAAREDAIPYGVPGVELTPSGKTRTFDRFLTKYELDESALTRLARIVSAADTGDYAAEPEANGLRAIIFGLGHAFDDDAQLVEAGLAVYAGLYAWCQRTPDRNKPG